MSAKITVPSVSVQYAQTGASTKANEMGMRVMPTPGAASNIY